MELFPEGFIAVIGVQRVPGEKLINCVIGPLRYRSPRPLRFFIVALPVGDMLLGVLRERCSMPVVEMPQKVV